MFGWTICRKRKLQELSDKLDVLTRELDIVDRQLHTQLAQLRWTEDELQRKHELWKDSNSYWQSKYSALVDWVKAWNKETYEAVLLFQTKNTQDR